jgi:hypothetical protein
MTIVPKTADFLDVPALVDELGQLRETEKVAKAKADKIRGTILGAKLNAPVLEGTLFTLTLSTRAGSKGFDKDRVEALLDKLVADKVISVQKRASLYSTGAVSVTATSKRRPQAEVAA